MILAIVSSIVGRNLINQISSDRAEGTSSEAADSSPDAEAAALEEERANSIPLPDDEAKFDGQMPDDILGGVYQATQCEGDVTVTVSDLYADRDDNRDLLCLDAVYINDATEPRNAQRHDFTLQTVDNSADRFGATVPMTREGGMPNATLETQEKTEGQVCFAPSDTSSAVVLVFETISPAGRAADCLDHGSLTTAKPKLTQIRRGRKGVRGRSELVVPTFGLVGQVN